MELFVFKSFSCIYLTKSLYLFTGQVSGEVNILNRRPATNFYHIASVSPYLVKGRFGLLRRANFSSFSKCTEGDGNKDLLPLYQAAAEDEASFWIRGIPYQLPLHPAICLTREMGALVRGSLQKLF
ncbi:hypothetical protein TNIN_212631 [Trichonephila inaurata madagascariensis]|uniref:Uncharacterized protein n=1 Tax=Trichonephila inaurata madagascariensis TaxID=2747483 RepID=A0A8X7BTI4_9ARAC|nr:hypothetical protein TNIN_212631 [Trichonephila inaurata madagascariensis]